jgi:hypothetical protein
MNKLRSIHFFAILMLSLCFILSSSAQDKKDSEDVYTIKQGDTLWDISSNFLKNPFLWPKLWQRNPNITNPHWIYPGQSIRISPPEDLKKVEEIRPREEAKQVLVEEKPEEKSKELAAEAQVKKGETPEGEKKQVASVEVKPGEEKPAGAMSDGGKPSFNRDVRSAGFLSDINLRGVGIILDNKEGKNLMSEGDIVYVAFRTSRPVTIGEKYTVFRASPEGARHPVTDKRIATKYNIVGNIQIIDEQGNFFTANVIEAFYAILKGDMLQPYVKERMEITEKK